jgi:hypothetical protein
MLHLGKAEYAALVGAVALGLEELIRQQILSPEWTAAITVLVVVFKAYLRPPASLQP